MQHNNIYINDFIDKLCRQRYDVNGKDIAQDSLKDLEFVLTPQEFQEVVQFDNTVRKFEHLAMEENVDITDAKNIEVAKKYEDFVDKCKIHPENKAALYNTLLGFIDINEGDNRWYMNVLRKKVEILPHGLDHELNLTAKQAFFHRRDVRSLYLNNMHKLYAKMQDKARFTFLNELGLALDANGKKMLSVTKMTPQQRLNRLSVIEAIVKEPLPVEMRIQLLEEGLKLANNNLRRRNENFELKGKFCSQLQKDYSSIGQYAKANNYGLEAYNWNKSFNLALEHGIKR